MKPMSLMRRFAILMAFAMVLMLFNADSDAQWDKLSPDERILSLGANGIDTTTAITATTVIPAKYKQFNGWGGLHLNQLAVDNTIEEQVAKGHIQGGFEVGDVNIEAFFDIERNKMKGIALQSQIGLIAFLDVYADEVVVVTAGGGNLFENEQVREDLGLDPQRYDEDAITPRIVAYAAADFGALQFLIKTSPQWKLEDMQAEATGSYEVEVAEKVSAEIRLSVAYDSHPVIEDMNLTRSYTVLANIEF
jgi:hypothetical protein